MTANPVKANGADRYSAGSHILVQASTVFGWVNFD